MTRQPPLLGGEVVFRLRSRVRLELISGRVRRVVAELISDGRIPGRDINSGSPRIRKGSRRIAGRLRLGASLWLLWADHPATALSDFLR